MRLRTIWLRKTHRYLGLFIGVQLLFWTVSGVFFAWNNIDMVHGDHLVAPPKPAFSFDTLRLAPANAAIAELRRQVPTLSRVKAIVLRETLRKPMYEIEYATEKKSHFALADAQTGALRAPLTAQEAQTVAEDDFAPEAPVASVEYVAEVEPSSEYREKPLPAYRVTFDHESGARIYVSAERGAVTARRNARWRAWDFLWMFHIMDFQERESFHNWLLRGFSAMGALTVLSGFALWAFTTPLLRRKRRP